MSPVSGQSHIHPVIEKLVIKLYDLAITTSRDFI